MDTIIERLTPIFRNVFEQNDLIIDETLSPKTVENWDSMTHTMLIEEIEKEFGIKFKRKDLKELENVSDIISKISSYL